MFITRINLISGWGFLFLQLIMDCKSTRIPYRQTGSFSAIALDYIDQAEALKPFYAYPPTLQGIRKSIEARKQYPTNRALLVQQLQEQYAGVESSRKVKNNIELLLSPETFTITTAHQNNIFTGPLYFIYKIIHAIKLADSLTISLPGHHFVPVFYIGSEDADLEELNNIHLDGKKIMWNTKQTGAVGRMKVDKALVKLIDEMDGQLAVLPHGAEIISALKKFYTDGTTIQDATFLFVNHLFAAFGLIVLLPDNAPLKKQMAAIFEDDLLNQAASAIVEATASGLTDAGYKVQANPREINLFYLKDDKRERMERVNNEWCILNTTQKFSKEELLAEVQEHPERFSPNVILRGLYQEMILPDIALIGGGGEIAYWLQLKELSAHYKVPFPVLVLRNSFLLVEKKWQEKIARLGLTAEDFFLPENELINKLVKRDTQNHIRLNGVLQAAEELYSSIITQASSVDVTLTKHAEAMKVQSLKKMQDLEKKMLRAEKRKFSDQHRQVHTIKEHLFPKNGLQERVENFSSYYAKWGNDFIQQLYKCSLDMEQEFVLLLEK